MKITKDTTATEITHRRHIYIEDGPEVTPLYFFTPGTKLKVDHVSLTWHEGEEIKEAKITGRRVLKDGRIGQSSHNSMLFRREDLGGFPDWLQELVSESVAIKA